VVDAARDDQSARGGVGCDGDVICGDKELDADAIGSCDQRCDIGVAGQEAGYLSNVDDLHAMLVGCASLDKTHVAQKNRTAWDRVMIEELHEWGVQPGDTSWQCVVPRRHRSRLADSLAAAGPPRHPFCGPPAIRAEICTAEMIR
jgi:hypothetical protein